MTTTIFLAVLFSAFLHAVWNAAVKADIDKPLAMTALVLGHIPIAIAALLISPAPAWESWPYMVAGIVFQFGYQIFLLLAYRAGDFTQVYPIARGVAPVLVTIVSVVFLDVDLTGIELLAVLMIAVGITSMSIVRQQDGTHNSRAAIFSCVTGCFIAAYSLVDGMGARIAGTALGFYGWVAIGNALAFSVAMEITRPGLLRRIPKQGMRVFTVGGSVSFVAYSIVVWAFTQAPIALVSALRETSIVFALLIGVFFLKERLDVRRLLSTAITLFGAVLLRFSKS